MGLLNTFTGDGLVGAGVSLLGGVFGSSSSSPSKQYKYQKKLIDLQNAYNQQNATIAYDRSRQLTQDSPLLEKIGKQQAGINTAFGQNGSVSSTSSAPQAAAVSIPSGPDVSTPANVLSQGVQNAVSNLLATATTNATVRKLNAESEGTEIDNMSRNYLNMKKAGLLSAQAAKTFKDVAYQSIVNKYADSRLSADANKANSDALIASADSAVRGEMNKANYDNLIADTYARFEQGLLTEKQALTEIKKWSLMRSEEARNYASANESNANVGLINQQTIGQDITNEINRDTKADQKAIFKSKRVQSWYDAQPKNVQQIILSSKSVRDAVNSLQSGNPLTAAQFSALGAAMGYENAGALVGSLLNLLSKRKVKAPSLTRNPYSLNTGSRHVPTYQ
jgi:hypothetical protein